MMDLIDLLEDRERRTVSVLAVVCGAVFLILLIFGVRARVDAGRATSRRSGIEADWNKADRARKSAVLEWSRWAQSETDVEELRQMWFYDHRRGIQAMRSDLREVFEKAGVMATEINYKEAEVVKGRLRQVMISFNWGGSYPEFRHFLETIEAHPRALFVSKINFRNVGGPGYVEAGLTLEGYSLDE